ncbi:MAG: glycerol-3-phosphate dehydrogenase/oxidase [Actinomycetota bacterium]|nr:glycerol-3-phosphate dehydrogenase/oxidase [Actinomycetota bacterium]
MIVTERRSSDIEVVKSEKFDVVIVGGGITGAGALLEASSRGYKACLVEKADFSSGTSSASSKLIHGGIRYLAQGEIALVYENLRERTLLLKNAPQLASYLDFVLLIDAKRSFLSPLGSPAMRFALTGYDLTGGFRIGRFHKKITVGHAKGIFPRLNASKFKAAYIYPDARCDDSELTLNVLKVAQKSYGAVALNYTEVVSVESYPSKVSVEVNSTSEESSIDNSSIQRGKSNYMVKVKDRTTGAEFSISTQSVVNATGAWATNLLERANVESTISIRPSKGVHIVVPAEKLPTTCAMVLPVDGDSRTIFVIPNGRYTYVGTTDTDLGSNPVRTEIEDVDYLLAGVNGNLDTKLTRSDVTGGWVGVRPLIAEKSGEKLAERTKDLSRRHKIISNDGMVTVTGGKLTTYRKMAVDVVDEIDKFLSRKTKSISQRLPIPRAISDFGDLQESDRLSTRLVDEAIADGWSVTIADIIFRRSRIGIYDQLLSYKLAAEIAAYLVENSALTKEEAEAQIDEVVRELEKNLPLKDELREQLGSR